VVNIPLIDFNRVWNNLITLFVLAGFLYWIYSKINKEEGSVFDNLKGLFKKKEE